MAGATARRRPASADREDGLALSPQGELPESVAEVRLGALDGGPDHSLGELIGTKPVVLNFFASWCAPCITEMPGFEAVHQSVGDQVTVVGMAYQDSPEHALDTVARTGVTYPTYGDPEGSALDLLRRPDDALDHVHRRPGRGGGRGSRGDERERAGGQDQLTLLGCRRDR